MEKVRENEKQIATTVDKYTCNNQNRDCQRFCGKLFNVVFFALAGFMLISHLLCGMLAFNFPRIGQDNFLLLCLAK